MALRPFLNAMQESGRVRVARPPEPPAVEFAGLAETLTEWDRAARLDAALTPPDFSLPAAVWAAVRLYRGCQFLTYREFSAQIVQQELSAPCPEALTPAVAWSADLTLRFLPDLIALARGISVGDPLVDGLERLACEWPLSSVGVAGLAVLDPAPFLAHPSLRRLYVDRILERRDRSRLGLPAVREAVREALGGHPNLCPEIAAALDLAPSESPA